MKENKNEQINEYECAPGIRPRLALYHANPRGTGCAIKMELHAAHGMTDGSIFCTFAAQKTVGNRLGNPPIFPTFDWDNAITAKLDFNDLSKMMQVFRGECEYIDNDHGLYHSTATAMTRIQLRHLIDPVSGYSFEVYRTPAGGGEEVRSLFLMTTAEALGICEAIGGCMYLVAFGIPALPNRVSVGD